MFNKILIANRGEIACRVLKTAKRLGIQTVGVYSDADSSAPHIQLADEAIHIGPPAAAQSYLVIDKIIEAAKRTGAQAIHPGYGFLSENAEFAERCESEKLVFIGPTAQTIKQMGSKAAAKDLMEQAGVPLSPGYQGSDQSLDIFMREAKNIGYPVLLKAVAGGGGKGMRLVEGEDELEEALLSARREAKSAFGDERFLVEKYIRDARHLEVQIFGDGKGNVVHFFERDCSVQRRHQKIIEEAPAPNLSSKVRKRLLDAGVAAGKAVQYRGAGTVEFLYDGSDQVYFMEMNTRLQVEHPVSEEITGTDLVEWQLRVAAGEPLPCTQDQIKQSGHSFEARIYAEDPGADFIPSTGVLTTLKINNGNTGNKSTRIDSGVTKGQDITPFYDPMIAKLITHGDSREEALGTLRRALKNTHIAGVESNTSFLHALAAHPEFIKGNVTTGFIQAHHDALFTNALNKDAALAAWVLWMRKAVNSTHPKNAHRKETIWNTLPGWRVNQPSQETFWFKENETVKCVHVNHLAKDQFHLHIEENASASQRRENDPKNTNDPKKEKRVSFTGSLEGSNLFKLTLDGHQIKGFIAPHNDNVRVWLNGESTDIKSVNILEGAVSNSQDPSSLNAPMPGTITALVKKPGDTVEAGEILLVMEAMKMEHAIKAPAQGIVRHFPFDQGDQIKQGDLLVGFETT